MAKILEDIMVVKVAQIVKDNYEGEFSVSDEVLSLIEEAITAAVPSGAVVEIERATP